MDHCSLFARLGSFRGEEGVRLRMADSTRIKVYFALRIGLPDSWLWGCFRRSRISLLRILLFQ